MENLPGTKSKVSTLPISTAIKERVLRESRKAFDKLLKRIKKR